MTKNDLQTRIAEVLGVSVSEKELAFDIFISKIAELLTGDLTIKVPRIGYFQLKKSQNEIEKPTSIIYSSFQEDLNKDSEFFYLTIDIPYHEKNISELETNFFSIGVGKPLLPLGDGLLNEKDAEASYIILQKSIEERVNEIISESEHLPNFNIWDDYYKSVDKKESETQTKLSELTSDIDFKEEFIAEEITNNLLDHNLSLSSNDISETDEINTPELSPSELLDDYQPKTNQTEIDNIINSDNNELEHKEKQVEENKEIEIELGKHRKNNYEEINLRKNNFDDVQPYDILSEKDNISLGSHISPDDSYTEDYEDKEADEDESYLGLKKKANEKIEWNWGDELREELEVTNDNEIYDDFELSSEIDQANKYESYDSDFNKEREKADGIFKTTKPLSSKLFEELESSIKKEITESIKELSYNHNKRSKYEFIEDEQFQGNIHSHDYEEEKNYVDTEYSDKTSNRNFGKTFLILFSSFIVITTLIIYVMLPSKNTVRNQLPNIVQQKDTVQKTEKEIASIPIEKQNITLEEESDFPRVASLPSIKKATTSNQSQSSKLQVIEPKIYVPEISDSKELYRTISNDMRINKTIYYDGVNYNVQVSSWRNRLKAEQEVKRLRKEGYDAFVLIANLPEKGGIWYRVRVGSFKTEAEAKEFFSKNNF